MKSLLSGLDEKTRKLLLLFIKILIAFVVVIVIFMIIASCSNKGGNYSKLENVMENAANSYYSSHNDELPSSNGESKKITISELVSAGYMKTASSYVTDSSCDGYVTVTKSDTEYNYIPNVSCAEYKTNTLASVIKKDIVVSDDGVYSIDGGYYYRGKKVNNYIKLGNVIYMIIGMDSNNNVKLIETEVERDSIAWDSRYNTELNTTGTGMNTFERSVLQEKLQEKYTSMDPMIKKYILLSDWCVGKRSMKETDFTEVECEETSKNYIATISAYEYARISVEEECKSVLAGACNNYNFINDRFDSSYWTITPVAESSYESYSLSSSGLESDYVSRYYTVIKAFNISGNNIVKEGDGSLINPFIIK